MREFNVDRDYYNDGMIYKKNKVVFEPGLTVLVGCNGSGKTTLLHQIKRQCEDKEIPVIHFDNLKDGGSHAASYQGFMGNTGFLAQHIVSSEGEDIVNNMGLIAQKIGTTVRKTNPPELFILLDAIDSGLSVDNVLELKHDLLNFVLEINEGKDFYFIVSANEYEMAKGERCMNVRDLEYVDIPDYETYRKIIIKTRKDKNKRYKWDPFTLS